MSGVQNNRTKKEEYSFNPPPPPFFKTCNFQNIPYSTE